MTKILIFGAGRSSAYFIKQVQNYCLLHEYSLTIIDENFINFPQLLKNHASTTYIKSSIEDKKIVEAQISSHDIVVSMLPPSLHIVLAKACLFFSKNFLTASYVNKEIEQLNTAVKKAGLLFLNEVGVDPGLDHVSALMLLDKIKEKGGVVKSFKSHTGGIIAKKTNLNLWDYRITWNPKNVITAGCDGAVFLENKAIKKINYFEIFSKTEKVVIDGQLYDSYANRDSLKYIEKYGLKNIDTCYRGTLRHHDFCEAWDIFVQLGMTNQGKRIEFNGLVTREDFLSFFLPKVKGKTTKEIFMNHLSLSESSSIIKKFEQLNFFNDNTILLLQKETPAKILQTILEKSWAIEPSEKDMLLMHHEVIYALNGKSFKVTSTLKTIGEDPYFTAMAKTVGAPLFECLKLMLGQAIDSKGVLIPNQKEIYKPLFLALSNHKLFFEETTTLLHEGNE